MKRFSMMCVLLCTMMLAVVRVGAQGEPSPYYYCSILDEEPESIWDAQFGHVFAGSNDAPGWDDVGFFELKGSIGLWYHETNKGGDLDLRASTDTRILRGFDGTTSGYPLSIINLFLRWNQRFAYGYGLQVDLKPGLYSSLDGFSGDNWAFPFTVAGLRALNEDLSVLAGLSIYPSFDRVIDPKIGARWLPSDDVSVDVFYPETKLKFQLSPVLSVHVGARFLNWLEFQMDDDDARDRLQLDESRLSVGVDVREGEYGKWTIDFGYYFDRTVDFEAGDAGVDIDDSFGISLGYTSLF